jgi:hypothetical protein
MPPSFPTPPDQAREPEADTSPVEDMRQADVANGENPDEETSQRPPAAPPSTGQHPTGDQQARDNRDEEPPA